MESNANVSLMVMYDDESVEVRYRNEDVVHLSPCGSEFVVVKASGHPPLRKARVRQRTRFSTSTHKKLIIGALKFRNTYASQPYLPEELIPDDHKKPFFSTDSDVKWPEMSSCVGELGCDGEAMVRSEDGRAVLTLAPSGQEFSVKYTCSLSSSSSHDRKHSTQPGNRECESSPGAQQPAHALVSQGMAAPEDDDDDDDDDDDEEQLGRRKRKLIRLMSGAVQAEPEAAYRSTAVVQQLSCRCVPPCWRYPLSLVQRLHATRLCEPADVRAEASRCWTPVADPQRHSDLPQALPLTCPSPHLHRWRFTDPLFTKERPQRPGDLVKVMWCHGVTFRVLSGLVSVVEVSPGDGSIIRSNGVLSSYFTHHKPELHSGRLKVKEVTYHVQSLPPDLPGQPYSVRSVVTRASRILSSYSKAKQSPAAPSCFQVVYTPVSQLLYELNHIVPPLFEGWQSWRASGREEDGPCPASAEQRVMGTHTEDGSGLVAAELEKIKRFNFLLDASHLLGREELEAKRSGEEVEGEAVGEEDIAGVLQRTSQAIRDIDALVTAARQTSQQDI